MYHVRPKFLRGILIFVAMKRIIGIFFIGLVCISADLPNGAIKKMDKTIQALWENQVVNKAPIDLTLQPSSNKDLQLKKLNINNKLVAYLAISRAKSRIDFFDYMIIYNTDLSIKTIQVLAYREDYGGEIASKRWLKQFEGKSNAKDIKFGDDVQSISGATLSARSLTEDVQEVTTYIQLLKSKGTI